MARTDDAGYCWAEASRRFMPHVLRPQTGEPFGWAFHSVGIGDTVLAYHEFRSMVEVVASEPMDAFYGMVLLRGTMEVSTEHGTTYLAEQGSACVVSPTEKFIARFTPGTRQVFVKIPVAVVEQAFGRLTGEAGGGRIIFDLATRADAPWPAALKLAVQTIDGIDSGLPVPPPMGGELERLCTSSLLLAQPHSASGLLARPSPGRAARAATMVAKAVQASPEQDYDFADMARLHGVSLRTLQDGFRNRYGRSPSAFLRDARLDMAHTLLAGDKRVSVTDAALSCGFTHLGRFARDYRVRYGFSPSETREGARGIETVREND
ncbi:AraC family transcriptional regulator (plasmid) [Mycolicibacterium psychrotolerans]|uniref:AraC family transcriptional regulator n=1 Tax=Mycolicibacterium psychrotolerans TaxID=216929 RepID=UPI003D66D290